MKLPIRPRRLRAALASAWLLAAAATAGADGPGAALARLETAFRDSSAAGIRSLLPADRRVYLAIPAVHDQDGFLGTDQVYYLFKAFFDDHATRSFAIPADGVERKGRTAFARADWRHARPGEAARSEPLVFTLVDEGDRWVVTEIRASRS